MPEPTADLETQKLEAEVRLARVETAEKLVTMLAVAVGAAWTLYQWDVSIFPKEKHEEFLRRAAARVDVLVKPGELAAKDLRPPGPGGRSVLLSGTLKIENQRDFPVALGIQGVEVGLGGVKVQADGVPAAVEPFTEDEVLRPRPGEAFPAELTAEPLIIEARSEAALPLMLPLAFKCPKGGEGPCMVSLRVRLGVTAVHPKTGELLTAARKQKTVVTRGILGRRMETAATGFGFIQ
ncbi:MAG: hypothetical protein FJW40_23950 [Acidobacteria bacterium]|nr:hypothetical protein [Acidobacteriota bacterium]